MIIKEENKKWHYQIKSYKKRLKHKVLNHKKQYMIKQNKYKFNREQKIIISMYSQNPYNITVLPLNQNIVVELDQTITVREIFELIKEQFNSEGNIEIWTCFSTQRQIFFKINDQIGYQQNENFLIDTQPVQAQQSQQGQNIILNINIKDGQIDRVFQGTFNSNDTLENVAQTIQKYCQISELGKVVAIDLFIFESPYNDIIKRLKTLSDLQLKNNTTIQAKIRWIGG